MYQVLETTSRFYSSASLVKDTVQVRALDSLALWQRGKQGENFMG